MCMLSLARVLCFRSGVGIWLLLAAGCSIVLNVGVGVRHWDVGADVQAQLLRFTT